MAAAAPTMTLVSQFDERNSSVVKPVWEYVATGLWDADDTADGSVSGTFNGVITTIILTVPANTNSVTGQLVLKDSGSNTVFDSGEKAAGATYVFEVSLALSGTSTLTLGISGAAGTTGITLTATFRGI